jgi:hypothetical protein
MRRTKSKAVMMASDGAGGMTQIHDRRFDKAEWPIRLVIDQQGQADTWFKYLSSECTARGWSSSVMAQLDSKENSGSCTVSNAGGGDSQLIMVWERERNGPLLLRARTVGEFPLTPAQDLIDRVTERCRAGVKERFYLRSQLCYEGLPWRGELWLSDKLRLGPPSKYDETALIGPRSIMVDALVDGIDKMDAGAALGVLCRELSTFLSVVLRHNVALPRSGRAWTFVDVLKPEQCEIRWLGYLEASSPTDMPGKGQVRPIPLEPVRRPDFSIHGLWPDDREMEPPADIASLWEAFSELDADRRRQFLQVASMWHLAISLGYDYQTTAFAWMVVATEALKPGEPLFRDHNIYEVVEGLLGKRVAAVLRKEGFRPQEVRNAHLHRGEFRGSEFVQHLMMSSFHDPTFDSAHRVLTDITQAAIIEWLRRGGVFTMPSRNRSKNWRRWVKGHTMTAAAIAVGLGLVLGWLSHGIWLR